MKFCGKWFPIGLLLLFILMCGTAWCSDNSGGKSLRGFVFTVDCQVPDLLRMEITSPGNPASIITSAEVSTEERRPIADICVTSRELPHCLLRFSFHPLHLDAPSQAILPYRAYVLLDGYQSGTENIYPWDGNNVDAVIGWFGKVSHDWFVVFIASDNISSADATGYVTRFHLFADIEQTDYLAAATGTYSGSLVIELLTD